MNDGDAQSVEALMLHPSRRTPDFIKDASATGLVKAVMRLAMEVSVLRERMDIYEALAQRHGYGDEAEFESFVADEDLQQKRAARRDRLVRLLVDDLS